MEDNYYNVTQVAEMCGLDYPTAWKKLRDLCVATGTALVDVFSQHDRVAMKKRVKTYRLTAEDIDELKKKRS